AAAGNKYLHLKSFTPWYVAVHWPSKSQPTLAGYSKIRDRAAAMTHQGDAEFFLAALLGYLDRDNPRGANPALLRSRGGFRIHCVGHSFGGRFLAAAILASVFPQSPST